MRYVNGAYTSLMDYFVKMLNTKMKKNIQLAYTSRIIFTSKTDNNDN